MKILDVGQCGFDGPRMRKLFTQELGATVVNAATAEDALQKIADGGFDVVLVNRILAADGSEGSELVEQIAQSPDAPPVMLVSDYEEAQDDAVAKGAVRGFGKSELGEAKTLERIREVAEGGR